MPTQITSEGIIFNDLTTLTSATVSAARVAVNSVGTPQLTALAVTYDKLATDSRRVGARAWVNFDGRSTGDLLVTGTYVQSGTTTVTVTIPAGHNLTSGQRINISAGGPATGQFVVVGTPTNLIFTYNAAAAGTGSGSITLLRSNIRASYNVSSVTKNAAGNYVVNFITPMPDTNYVITGSCNGGSITGTQYLIFNGSNTGSSNIKDVWYTQITSSYVSTTGGGSTLYDHQDINVAIFGN